MCLYIYSNETEAQNLYKQNCRKLSKNEKSTHVVKRHSYIAHWARFLFESCTNYGTHLKENESVYCGINQKLVVTQLSFDNHAPLSTSSSIIVAKNFATMEGMILKLQSNNVMNCKHFDMMLISDYIQEKKK
eukprot:516898_1